MSILHKLKASKLIFFNLNLSLICGKKAPNAQNVDNDHKIVNINAK